MLVAAAPPKQPWRLNVYYLVTSTKFELATMTVKATGPITSSVANTAKRVIVVLYMAAITGKSLTEEQKIGAAVAIGGVFLYSVIDDIFAKKAKTKMSSRMHSWDDTDLQMSNSELLAGLKRFLKSKLLFAVLVL